VWRDALLVAGKDLRIEGRSRVALNQVLPFAVLVLVLFAFALDPDRGVLVRAAAGLYWVAVLFSALLAVQRSQAVEVGEGTRDALRLSGSTRPASSSARRARWRPAPRARGAPRRSASVVLYGVDPAGLGSWP
jgi:heme exporter protein CcmB